jgi:O-antigen/teichoic acid export membrane protein
MDASTPIVAAASAASQRDTTKKHIRGSSLLLVGRLLSLVINLAVQVLMVRYLSKSDYGAFAYALSIASLGSSLAVFGLDKSITRFIPIYQEQGDYNKLFGTIVMMVGSILSLGLAIVLVFHGLHGVIAQSFISDQQAVSLLLILIVLAPIDALDSLLVGMFAIFASPRAIFFRRHVLGPGLKLSAVLLLVLGQSDVYFLAGGYLAAGILGLIINLVMLFRVLGNRGLFQHFNFRAVEMPAQAVFGFTIPLLTADLVFVLTSSLVIMLLEYFGNTTDVATFRAVVPVARLNLVVIQSFKFLFTPLAARMFARDDQPGINDLYWQSATWIAVISFPIFVMTFSLAWPLTILLFGVRYEKSAIILVLLALGHYFNAALGFNGMTLRVLGKVRYTFIVSFLTLVIGLGLNLLLIPSYGAVGAAIGTCGTLIAQNIFYQAGLLNTGINLFEWRYLKVYLSIMLGALGLLLVQLTTSAPIYGDFALAVLVSLGVIVINRKLLNIEQTFPELLRFPLVRRLFNG